jgi:hypothetical protein
MRRRRWRIFTNWAWASCLALRPVMGVAFYSMIQDVLIDFPPDEVEADDAEKGR